MDAHARVCLVGEDLDWTNGKSILCGIDLQIHISIEWNYSDANIIIINEGKTEVYAIETIRNESDFQDKYVIAGIFSWIKMIGDIRPMKIFINSHIPIKSGLSSSAALFGSLFSSLNEIYSKGLSKKQICELGYYTEFSVIKSVVGYMDFYACLENGIIQYDASRKTSKRYDYRLEKDTKIVLIFVENSSSTKEVNQQKKRRYLERESSFMSYLKKSEELVSEMHKKIIDNNINELGEKIVEAHYLMSSYLKVSSERIDNIVRLCMKNGAYGAKLTGCGLGGYVFCLINEYNLYKLKKIMIKAHMKYIVTNII